MRPIFRLGVLLLASAPAWTEAATPAPAAVVPAPHPAARPAVVMALVCVPPAPVIGPVQSGKAELIAAALNQLGASQGAGATMVSLVSVDGTGACEAIREGRKLADSMPDLVVAVSEVTGSSGSNREQVRVGFRVPGRDFQVNVLGRVFAGAFTTRTLLIPAPPPSAPLPRVEPDEQQRGAPIVELQVELVSGLTRAVAYRKLKAGERQNVGTHELAENARKKALEELARADTEWLSAEAPTTSAVLKQIRATLLLDGPCGLDSTLELLNAAARLVPYSAEAHTLAAMARLKGAYEPSSCPLTAEQELFRSLELDPWSNDAVDNLGLLYELAVNAHSDRNAAGGVSTDDATQTLERVWKQDAPLPPRALEMAVAVGFSSAVDQSVGELAPSGRFELGYGRDGSGWGVRLGLGLPWSRQMNFPGPSGEGVSRQAWVSWTRFTLDLGPRYRLRLGPLYGEVAAAALAAAVVAKGHGFDLNYSPFGSNFGGMGTLRIGQRLGRFSIWAGAAVSYFVSTSKPMLVADGSSQQLDLPSFDVSVLGGVSALLWR